mmetsp:Transcript_96698/g.270659  ORF Transcript_96698/g.270659 Transcript_96698/m.270659 type:complete len:208 (-) Transcript_96698:439-1062(-)
MKVRGKMGFNHSRNSLAPGSGVNFSTMFFTSWSFTPCLRSTAARCFINFVKSGSLAVVALSSSMFSACCTAGQGSGARVLATLQMRSHMLREASLSPRGAMGASSRGMTRLFAPMMRPTLTRSSSWLRTTGNSGWAFITRSPGQYKIPCSDVFSMEMSLKESPIAITRKFMRWNASTALRFWSFKRRVWPVIVPSGSTVRELQKTAG